MNKNFAIGLALVAIVIAIGAFFVLSHSAPKSGAISTQDNSSSNYTQLGVSNGLFVTGGGIVNSNGCQSNGNVTTCTVRQSLVSGTTTPCAIANPIVGTSTVLSSGVNITTATSSAITWSLGTSTTAFATSSSMMTSAVAAGAQQAFSYAAVNNAGIGSGQFVILGITTGTLAATGAATNGVVFGGTCQATFQSMF